MSQKIFIHPSLFSILFFVFAWSCSPSAEEPSTQEGIVQRSLGISFDIYKSKSVDEFWVGRRQCPWTDLLPAAECNPLDKETGEWVKEPFSIFKLDDLRAALAEDILTYETKKSGSYNQYFSGNGAEKLELEIVDNQNYLKLGSLSKEEIQVGQATLSRLLKIKEAVIITNEIIADVSSKNINKLSQFDEKFQLLNAVFITPSSTKKLRVYDYASKLYWSSIAVPSERDTHLDHNESCRKSLGPSYRKLSHQDVATMSGGPHAAFIYKVFGIDDRKALIDNIFRDEYASTRISHRYICVSL